MVEKCEAYIRTEYIVVLDEYEAQFQTLDAAKAYLKELKATF